MKRLLQICLVNLAVVAAVLVAAEGIAGYAMAITCGASSALAERRHTMYDPELGWVNQPNVDIADMYGPRVRLRTNGQGFRNDRDFPARVPAGTLRVVCSGDSFTLGYGVADDRTWCHRLTSFDSRLESINMGQGGYGMDQAYLWFKRDGTALDHQVHVFAVITEDIRRLGTSDFEGYGKPVLVVEDGRLVVKGVPVSRLRGVLAPLRQSVQDLRTVAVLRDLLQRLRPAGRDVAVPLGHSSDDETRQVVSAILADLKRLHDMHGRVLLLAYLPTLEELTADAASPWRDFMASEARARGITLIDTFDVFAAQPAGTLDRLFIQEGQLDYPGSAGHLTAQGNELVAGVIYEQLKRKLHAEATP